MTLPSWRTIKARMPAILLAASILLGWLTSADVLPLLPERIGRYDTGKLLFALTSFVALFVRPLVGPAAARAGAQYRDGPPAPPTPEHPERQTSAEAEEISRGMRRRFETPTPARRPPTDSLP